MTSYYSILFISIRPLINEQLSIALLANSGNNVYFKFSKEKLNMVKNLISNDSYDFVRHYIEGIKKDVISSKPVEKEETLWVAESSTKYSYESIDKQSDLNNIIKFTEPQGIDIVIDDDSFEKLFKKYISDEKSRIIVSNLQIKNARKNLYPKIKYHVNLDIEINKIDPEKFQYKMFYPKKINMIGKNGNYFTAQFINFEKRPDLLKGDLTFHYNFAREIKGNNFIIASKPVNNTENIEFWNDLIKLKELQVVDLNEIKKIEEFIFNNNIKPVL